MGSWDTDLTPPMEFIFLPASPMVCSGTKSIPLRFSCGKDSKVYTWMFQLAPVSVPLFGADFLEHFNLLFDIKGRKVVHAQCPESVVLHASPTPQPAFRHASFLATPPHIRQLLSKFPDVLSSDRFTASNLDIESSITISALQVLRYICPTLSP